MVELKAVFNKENLKWPLNVDLTQIKGDNLIHTLAARQMIRDLEEGF